MNRPRPVLGLVGQACAGKSSVAAAFGRRGARVIEADQWVRDLYREAQVKEQVRALFGNEVFTPDGEVDRSKLGALVFAARGKLAALTAGIVFPGIAERLRREVEAFRRGAGERAAALILDAPTLFEAGLSGCCDKVAFVAAPLERRCQWGRARRGWSPEELARRESSLLDEAQKRARCAAVIENTGTLADLDRRVSELWREWVEEPRRSTAG
jgi:dephospho-CoA kinase